MRKAPRNLVRKKADIVYFTGCVGAYFPLAQKWFAVGECMAHLDYLRLRGLAARDWDGAVWHYRAL